MKHLKHFGIMLREIREAQDITCVKLAKMTGISVRNIYRWENEDRWPRFHEDVVKICKALKISEEVFYEYNFISQRIKGLEDTVSGLQDRVGTLENKLMSLGIID